MSLSKQLFMQDIENTPQGWNEEAECFGFECKASANMAAAKIRYAAERQQRAEALAAERKLEAWGRAQDERHNKDNRKFYND